MITKDEERREQYFYKALRIFYLYRELSDRRYSFVRSKNARMNQVYELARKVAGSG